MHGINGMGWGMGFGWIAGFIILILIIWLITKVFNNNLQPQRKDKSALDILKERYVRGEISEEEFEEKKKSINA
nr:SHOCT domain-containing protein [uncultured Carboxylicivirga sp.]